MDEQEVSDSDHQLPMPKANHRNRTKMLTRLCNGHFSTLLIRFSSALKARYSPGIIRMIRVLFIRIEWLDSV